MVPTWAQIRVRKASPTSIVSWAVCNVDAIVGRVRPDIFTAICPTRCVAPGTTRTRKYVMASSYRPVRRGEQLVLLVVGRVLADIASRSRVLQDRRHHEVPMTAEGTPV